MPEPAPSTGILLTVAPAATDLPHLLRIAIDAEQVGAARIHLAFDQADPAEAVAAIRDRTRLIITTDPGHAAAGLADRVRAGFVERLIPESLSAAEILVAVAEMASEHGGDASVGGRGAAAVPVLLAALAVGLHVRVGTSDLAGSPGVATGGGGPREDVALIARAAGLARIAGRPALPVAEARAVLGLS